MKNRRGLIFLGLALVMGIAAARISTQMSATPVAEIGAEAEVVSVVVVRMDLAVASTLSDEQLEMAEWPADHIPAGALRSIDEAVGRVVRRPIGTGEPVVEIALFDVGASGGLRAVISPKKRAVSVKVDNVIGVAGFVSPGSRVDVLATIRRVDLAKALPFSKVILQDIRVLAVDQKLEEVKSGDPELVNVVTLEVDPVEAEHLIYAAHEGRLQLAMRSPGDIAEVPSTSIGVADVLGEVRQRSTRVAKQKSYAPVAQASVELVSGSAVEVKTF
jgi:pilus assembly protein CpaB